MGAELGRPVKAESLVIAPSLDAAGENCTRILMVGEDGSRMVIDLDPQSTRQLAECASKASAGEGLSMFTIQPCEVLPTQSESSCLSVAEAAGQLTAAQRCAVLSARDDAGFGGMRILRYRDMGVMANELAAAGLTAEHDKTRLTQHGKAVRDYLIGSAE